MRILLTCVLGFGILYAWELWAGRDKPTLYRSVGKVHAGSMLPYESDALLATTVINTHVMALSAPNLRRSAAERMSMARPELEPVDVQINCRQHPGSTILEISGTGSEPRYVQGYLSELISEYLALRKKFQDWPLTPQGRQLFAHMIRTQRDTEEIKRTLEAHHTSGPAADNKEAAYLEETLAEAQDRRKFWAEFISSIAGVCESTAPMHCTVTILELPMPATVFKDKLDPLSVFSRHPWRAVTSFGVAALLSVGLIPPIRRQP